MLLVRARRPGDIERLLPSAQVQETPLADDRYRAVAPAKDVAQAIAARVQAIEYTNFKASACRELAGAYAEVWSILAGLPR
ncbi:MAG: hypothetical protein KatS3mg124_1850 [Porticoccaceae bacterium]|nr:MAG: hypothetical protein KatS3mg124_1850 [Porticoccaceae bacterium]